MFGLSDFDSAAERTNLDMDEDKILKRGTIIRHKGTKKEGLILDLGIFHEEYKKFVATDTAPDSIKVWSGGRIEIWPTEAVELIEA